MTPAPIRMVAGHPIADPCAAGSATLPSKNFCINMAGLGGESESLDPAPASGTAFVLEASGLTDPCDPVTGTISINALRDGLIGTDGEPMNTNLSITFSMDLDHCNGCPLTPEECQELCYRVGYPEC